MTRRLAAAAAGVALAALACVLLYRFDNKYTCPGGQPLSGSLLVEEDGPALRFLVREWEFYPDVLLSPGDFADGAAGRYRRLVSIGQYGGFDLGDARRSPHGRGTYRLTLLLPEGERDWAVELPEVFSSCRFFVGEREALALDGIQSRVVVFRGEGSVTLLLAASDDSHQYSGLVYPPAFGTPLAVNTVRGVRLCLRVFWFAAALCALGLCAVRRSALAAALCLCLCGYTGYPLLHTFVCTGVFPWYALELFCAWAIAPLIVLLHGRLCPMWECARRAVAAITGAFAVAALAYGLLLSGMPLWAMRLFSGMTECVKWLAAGWLVVSSAAAAAERRECGGLLLGASAFYGAALAADRLLPLYEPICGGYFGELGGAAVVMAVGAAAWREIVEGYRFRLAFAEQEKQIGRMLEMQRRHHAELRGRMEEIRMARHDLRHHLLTLRSLAQREDWEGLRGYLEGCAGEAGDPAPVSYCGNAVTDALLSYYAGAAARAGAEFTARAEAPEALGVADTAICIVLGNLLENALEAVRAQPEGPRFVRATVRQSGARLYLRVENSFAGVPDRRGGRYYSTKRPGRGYGIESVRKVAQSHGGAAEFEAADGVFTASVLLPTASADMICK